MHRYSCIKVFLLFLGSGSATLVVRPVIQPMAPLIDDPIPHSDRLQRVLAECPVVDDDDDDEEIPCDEKAKDKTLAEIDEAISSIQDGKGDLDCNDEDVRKYFGCFDDPIRHPQDGSGDDSDDLCSDPDDEEEYGKARGCIGLDQTICSLNARKKKVEEEFKEGCDKLAQGQMALVQFERSRDQVLEEMAHATLERRDDGPPVCKDFFDKADFEPLFNSIRALELVQISLDITASVLEIAADWADAIPYAGAVAEAALKGAANLIRTIIAKIESFISNSNKTLRVWEITNMDCTTERSIYYQGLTKRTVDFVENADPQIDNIEKIAGINQQNIDIIDKVVDANQQYLFETLDPKIDTIDTVVDENQLYLQFSACRYEKQVKFVGNGCDGLDNDCDSVIVPMGDTSTALVLVDECDEDQIPPTITLAQDIPATFHSLTEAEDWFKNNIVASDDCVPSDRLEIEITPGQELEGVAEIRVQVYDTRCFNTASRRMMIGGNRVLVDGPGEASTTETFTVFIDDKPPQVSCGFNKPQDANFGGGDDDNLLFIDRYNVRRDIVNVQFFYKIEEFPLFYGADKDVQVTVTISSNEFEESARIMTKVIKQKNQGGPPYPVVHVNALFAPFTCGDYQAGDLCLAEVGNDARFYDITVEATDPSGNIGEATCTVVAVPEYQCAPGAGKGCGKSSKKDRTFRPTRSELFGQLESSEQRYELDTISFVWNTGQDDSSVPPAVPLPTRGPKSAKRGTSAPTAAQSTAPTVAQTAVQQVAAQSAVQDAVQQSASPTAAQIATPTIAPTASVKISI